METYESYNLYNFTIPVGIMGDCYDRYLIRLEEMRESLGIMLQCLNFLSNYSTSDVYKFIIDDSKIAPPSRAFMKSSMEALIHHFKLYTEGFIIPEEETYVTVEAPKGELGVFLSGRSTNKPYRCRIKAPGFLHLQGLNFMVQRSFLADLVTIIGTQDLVFGEIDR
jgi:NADH:ubiquinone oxidoreductase subunit D